MDEVTNNFFTALCVVIGHQGCEWDYYELDRPEWELPDYAHQN